jgi:hypothetical protein
VQGPLERPSYGVILDFSFLVELSMLT